VYYRARTKQAFAQSHPPRARYGRITGAPEDAGMRRFAAGEAPGTSGSDH